MISRTLLYSLLVFLFAACGQNEPSAETQALVADKEAPAPVLTFAGRVEKAHAKADFLGHEAIRFDLQLFFGGSERFNGTLTLSTDSRRGLMETKDGKKTYFQDNKVFFPADVTNARSVRFSAYTWSYFFMFPYKLNDAGTVWNDYPDNTLDERSYLTGKLSFEPGTGDAPDDWYVVYADPKTELIQVAAYIVTAGQSQAEAEEDPHAIEYLNYREVNGIPIATEWKFRGWRADQGLTDELGNATLTNISFPRLEADFFTPPADFQEG